MIYIIAEPMGCQKIGKNGMMTAGPLGFLMRLNLVLLASLKNSEVSNSNTKYGTIFMTVLTEVVSF